MQPLNELIIELSRNCNLACTMCGFGGQATRPEWFMPLEDLARVLDAVQPTPAVIRLNGRGESTIHPHFVQALQLVRSEAPGARINLFSNMAAVKPEALRALMDCDAQLFVSVDSPDPARARAIRRGSDLHRVAANIERLASHDPRPFVIFTLQEANFEDVLPMAHWALERRLQLLVNVLRRDEGIEPFRAMVSQRAAELRDWFRTVAALYADTGLACLLPDRVQGVDMGGAGTAATHGGMDRCPALDRELCVLHDGTVTPCNMFEPTALGNLFTQSLDELREGPAAARFRATHHRNPYCADCACLGGTA
jgi:MoaA/NifB/PqqE/SkfB family radical SAM enzyme